MQLFRPDKKWPEPLPEKNNEDIKKEKPENDNEKIDEINDIDVGELERRLKAWEEDKEHILKTINDFRGQYLSEKDRFKREKIESSLNFFKQSLKWIEEQIEESQEKLEKIYSKGK